ncbi:VLRF1 family aeRF1-type release factor [Actinomadura hibisca]|uniref:VLRF1 family aeRF1-type release factor n=1 Tax=Actinomadura hibisca TaxID=68565 RepID=UPI0012FB8AE4|nr:VLRF1 family aeRF1-type release factor [Actinomadura hibisca]
MADLKELAGLGDETGVLSLYSTLDPGSPAGTVRLRNQLADLRSELDGDPDHQRARLVRDRLDALEPQIAGLTDPAGQGLGRALFAQVSGDEVRTTWVQLPVGDHAVLTQRARLWPLAVAVNGAAPAGVARVGRDGVRLFDLRYGMAQELEAAVFGIASADWAREGQVTTSTLSRRGIHPDKFDQRAEEHLAKSLREAAPEIADQARRHGWDRLVLAGDPRATAQLADDLAPGLATIQDDTVLDPYLSPAEVQEWAAPLLDGARSEADAELVQQAVGFAKADGNGALGLDAVMGPLAEGRVERLLVDPQGAWNKDDDEYLGDELIHLAAANSTIFTLVEGAGASGLAEGGGVGAILRW